MFNRREERSVGGRICVFAFVAATAAVHTLAELPGVASRAALLALLVVLAVVWTLRSTHGCTRRLRYRRTRHPLRAHGRRHRHQRRHLLPSGRGLLTRCIPPLCAALAGFLLTVHRADVRLSDVLNESDVNRVSRVELRVASLPRYGGGAQTFDAEVINSVPAGVPSRIRVSWRTTAWTGPYTDPQGLMPDEPRVVPGEVWRMALVLRTPHGARNPHGFDYEGFLFSQGVRATATVRGTPVFLRDQPRNSLGIIAERARYRVRQYMQPYLQDKRYGPVLLALAIGDQAGVPAADWKVFNRTGITHLVSISGTHVTMVAGMAGLLISFLWRRVRIRGRFLAERMPAQLAGGLAALLVAWLYCLLAGWGVPAQRTFLMLAVVAATYLFRIALAPSQLLAAAAFVVVLLDPWAILASGFWLSFGAVGVLTAMAGAMGHAARVSNAGLWYSMRRRGMAAVRVQLVISAALLPALAVLFHEISIVSPLANAYAIPAVSLVVTPLALLAALASAVPHAQWLAGWAAQGAHIALEAVMWPTRELAELPIASIRVAAAPGWLTLLALAGLVLAMLPRGVPGTWRAWLWLLPALAWLPGRPSHGDWEATVLDVGQAAAVVVRTAHYTLLFDTGVRYNATADAGDRIIAPFLRSQGVGGLDALVVSHADIDHVGGVRSLLATIPVQQSFASFDLNQWLRREAAMLDTEDVVQRPLATSPCRAGHAWEVDGVHMAFLWPVDKALSSLQAASRERNDRSCVLSIRGRKHSLLLTGDISASPEQQLVARGLRAHDIVVAAHHGSNSSSTDAFIAAVNAQHVIMQAGAWSRYGHPHPAVVRRWRYAGVPVWRTDLDGSVTVTSAQGNLKMVAERDRKQRYWQAW